MSFRSLTPSTVPSPPSTTPSASPPRSTSASPPPPPRTWSARLRNLLALRPTRRRPSSPPSTAPPSESAARPRRRHRRRSPTPDLHPLDAARMHTNPSALRYRRPDQDAPQPVPDPPTTSLLSRPNLAPNPVAPSRASALAELDAIEERDLFAVFHRLIDEYGAQPPGPAHAPDMHAGGSRSSYYVGRLPPHARHRVAMRVHNAYYITGGRRPARLTTELERDFRWSVRTLRFNAPAASRDSTATDEQIEKLPVFVMEKGETRSVGEIFGSMGVGEKIRIADDENGAEEVYTECAICLSDFEAGDEITLLPCGHFFHLTGCVREWLRNHARTCPTCRADICDEATSGLAAPAADVATAEEIS